MAGNDWLGTQRTQMASDRILDAASELFARLPVSDIGMNDIAQAAGCSRATLYRYFDNRDALHTAYVHREAFRVYQQMTSIIGEDGDPGTRLLAALTTSLALVRQSPPLAAWFTTGDSPIGTEIADQSDVIRTMVASFLSSLQTDDPEVIDRRARWIVRVLTSLLTIPGGSAEDERAMLEEFVIPMVCPVDQTA